MHTVNLGGLRPKSCYFTFWSNRNLMGPSLTVACAIKQLSIT